MLGKPRAEEYPVVDMQKVNESGLDAHLVYKWRIDSGLSFWSISAALFGLFSSIVDSCVLPVLGHPCSQVCTMPCVESVPKLLLGGQ